VKRIVLLSDQRVRLEPAAGALASSGLEAVSVASMGDARSQVEAGAVGLVVSVANAEWSGERASSLAAWPSALRRRCVVALLGPGFVTGDGVRAFLLGVDLLVVAGDAGKLGEIMSGALQSKGSLVAPLDPTAAARLGA
jgi:hypothetical protein